MPNNENTNPYKSYLEDWESAKSPSNKSDWDVRLWIRENLEGFSKFTALARGVSEYSPTETESWKVVNTSDVLLFYGYYGAVLGNPSPEQSVDKIEKEINYMEKIYDMKLFKNDTVLYHIIELAKSRQAIDAKEGFVTPYSLALLGNASMGRMRNLMSGKDACFSPEDAKIPVIQAITWLKGRPAYWPSIWKKSGSVSGTRIRVPVAADGTLFCPALRRKNGYMIGKKGDEQIVGDFYKALEMFQLNGKARWRRPNSKGNWGIVTGTKWVWLTKGELEAIRL